jgi:hypothetical protein
MIIYLKIKSLCHTRNFKANKKSTNYLEYCNIVGAVPKERRNLFQSKGDCRLKNEKKKPCRYFYILYLENIKESPIRSQSK